jgi:hypothetical protein
VDAIIESPGGARKFLAMVQPAANATRLNGVPIGGVPGAPSAGGGNSRGLRNNNPGNIRKSNVGWAGKIEGADADFETFNSPEAGIAALAKNLVTYSTKHGLNTIEGVINRWAPPSENNTGGYVKAVAKQLGVDPAAPLNMSDPGVLTQLTQAIIQHENGAQPYSAQQVGTGVQAALGNAILPAAAPVASMLPETSDKSLAIGNAAFDALPYQVQLQKIRLAETRMNQEMAVLQSRVKSTVQDHQAEAMTTGLVGQPLSQRDMVQAFGEAEGVEMFSTYKKNVIDLGADVRRVRTMSIPERQAELARYKDQIKGDGAAAASARFETLQRAVNAMDEALKKDPAAYVLNIAPGIKDSFQAMMDQDASEEDRSAATQSYVTQALAEQRRLGVDKPVLLPDQVADQIVSRFYEQPQGGQNAAALVSQLANQWGPHWPQVYGQLSKKLPAAAVVIGAGMKPGPATLLAEAAALGKEEMRKSMAPATVRDLGEALQKHIQPFMSSMSAQNNGEQTANRVFEGTELLALRYVRTGMSAKDAAKQAYMDTVGEKYTMQGTYRVPAAHDAQLVARGAERALSNLDTFGVQVPPSQFGIDAATARSTYVRSLKANSRWVTAADESGLVLYNAFGGAVMGADGKPVKQTWAELTARGATMFDSDEVRKFKERNAGTMGIPKK